MRFDKPALTVAQQIELLRQRGLRVDDEQEAEHYLKFIGYYRLSGYALPLSQKHTNGTHNFKPGVGFRDILKLYIFDRELRLIVNDAIERVEVAFRTRVSDYMAVKYGPHWLLKPERFAMRNEWQALLARIAGDLGFQEDGQIKEAKGRDVFIEHYFLKYADPKLPPSWMLTEVVSISCWSKAFQNLSSREDRKAISTEFGLNPEVLGSWMHAISYTRNICAHHARLWNREFTIKPMVAKGQEAHLRNNGRFYAIAYVINCLLMKASPQATWWERLVKHVEDNRFIDKAAMGFPEAGHRSTPTAAPFAGL